MGRLSVFVLSVSVCDVGVLCPNGWMDQDETWHRGKPRPHCVRWGPSSPPLKGAQSPHFRPMSVGLVANQLDGSRYHLIWRPRPRSHCVGWRPSSPERAQQPPPSFRPMSIVAKLSPISATAELLLLDAFASQ